MHPTKKTYLVAYNNQNYFDSYGMCPPEKLSNEMDLVCIVKVNSKVNDKKEVLIVLLFVYI